MKPFEKLATSIKGMVAMYEVSQATVERAIAKGELPVARKGRRIIIRISDAERWIGKSK